MDIAQATAVTELTRIICPIATFGSVETMTSVSGETGLLQQFRNEYEITENTSFGTENETETWSVSRADRTMLFTIGV